MTTLLVLPAWTAADVACGRRTTAPAPHSVPAKETVAVGYRMSRGRVEVIGVGVATAAFAPYDVAIGEGDAWTVDGGTITVPAGQDPGHRWLWTLGGFSCIAPTVLDSARLTEATTDLIEALACGITAVSVWEHCRVGRPIQGLIDSVPPWAAPWVVGVATELQASADLAFADIGMLAAEGVARPGPYQRHVEDALAGRTELVNQRVWARLRPGRELPAR